MSLLLNFVCPGDIPESYPRPSQEAKMKSLATICDV